jgi:hypothetical protein
MRHTDRLSTTFWAPLSEARISERRRRSLSAATVAQYRRWLDEGREAPPVRLVREGDGYAVRDGRHRVAAALAAGHTLIAAELLRIAQRFGRWFRRRPNPTTGT